MIGARGRRLRPVHAREHRHRGGAHLPRQLGRAVRVHQPPRVDQLEGRGEHLQAVEEERPLLRIVQRLPRVELDLRRVRLDLREVGTHRAVEGQVGGDAPPRGDADLGIAAAVLPARGLLPARQGARRLGRHVEHEPAVQVGESGERPALGEEGRLRLEHPRPGQLMTRGLHHPDDVEAPVLRITRLVAQGLERDPHLDLVAPGGLVALGFVDVVGAQVERIGAGDGGGEEVDGRPRRVAQRAVGLHAERVHAEDQRLAPVVEGVEQDLDVVVAGDLVAIGERGAHAGRVLVGADAEVDGRRRVPDQHRGRVVGRPVVVGEVLREATQHRGPRPDRLVESTVHGDDGVADPRHGHGRGRGDDRAHRHASQQRGGNEQIHEGTWPGSMPSRTDRLPPEFRLVGCGLWVVGCGKAPPPLSSVVSRPTTPTTYNPSTVTLFPTTPPRRDGRSAGKWPTPGSSPPAGAGCRRGKPRRRARSSGRARRAPSPRYRACARRP